METFLVFKSIFLNKKEKVERGATFIKWGSAEKTDELIILKALAVEEVGDVSVLENQELMTSIWEEYAMAGMGEFCNWARDNSIDLQSKIEDVMTEFHDKNMLVSRRIKIGPSEIECKSTTFFLYMQIYFTFSQKTTSFS